MKILSIDGGGYLGLASASFLSGLEDHFESASADRFDMFCGTSTGAIIALALATGMSGKDVVDLYERLGPEVFPSPNFLSRQFPKLRGVFAVRHDNTALRSTLHDAFGDSTLGDIRKRGKKVMVIAFSLTSARPVVFKTDHTPELTGHDKYLVRDVALASSAAPTFLPIVPLKDPISGVVERYCDGGVVANSPALLGYAEGCQLALRSEDIALLSVGTPRADLTEPLSALSKRKRSLNRSYLGWGLGERIITLALDGSVLLAHSVLDRIAATSGATYKRVTFAQPDGLGLDVVTPEATSTLRQLGADKARPAPLRHELSVFFS